ncbi:23S ribosomal RNA methyltransferase Erm [Propionimicrobium sp. PCR01-08-3]|uniref:23S ribosomal RNA methyltransferase Erm n=1 Tax=Propionimicrobium sp. PCR01-08-3 TaxID=3052086 RepID=UPI00255CB37B|nr:23S ribosomal RNA methyltransferase Erm [Propionimicrobium sp. PCR01-08-3]WIY83972.1 23S ribosomal RNA methyltransferase Erm [Propionimicrobium sp. PCR01-08-3]
MPRSIHGGRHELGQNFLHHKPTIKQIIELVAAGDESILELGAGDGSLTRALAQLGRPLTAIDIDEHRVRRLQRALPQVTVRCADALSYPLQEPVIVGNIPFHLTTPILRRLLSSDLWQQAVLLTQWEVARKRAGVGGGTMMTAQTAPWFSFTLCGRVPARYFTPSPSVDGGILQVRRRPSPLVCSSERLAYEHFVRSVFTGRGGTLLRIVQNATSLSRGRVSHALTASNIRPGNLPRDLSADQWASLWDQVSR